MTAEARWVRSRIHLAGRVVPLAAYAGVLHVEVTIKPWMQGALVEPVRLTSWFYLKIYHNAGLFLGSLPVTTVSVAYWLFACAALVWIWWRMATVQSLPVGTGYALLAAGLTGNSLGRVQGEVVDYLAFGPLVDDKWLFANVSDVAILGGLVLLTCVLVWSRMKRRNLVPGLPD